MELREFRFTNVSVYKEVCLQTFTKRFTKAGFTKSSQLQLQLQKFTMPAQASGQAVGRESGPLRAKAEQ